MVIAAKIESDEIYDEAGVCEILAVPRSGIQRECRDGRLRFSKRAGKRFFRGQWLLDWMDGDSTTSEGRTDA
jgi:hypothetical protein